MNAMPIPLGNAMHIMCSALRKRIREQGVSNADHCDLCNWAATEYDLYYDNKFPIWLSRVVEGIIRDVESGEDDQL